MALRLWEESLKQVLLLCIFMSLFMILDQKSSGTSINKENFVYGCLWVYTKPSVTKKSCLKINSQKIFFTGTQKMKIQQDIDWNQWLIAASKTCLPIYKMRKIIESVFLETRNYGVGVDLGLTVGKKNFFKSFASCFQSQFLKLWGCHWEIRSIFWEIKSSIKFCF